MIIPGKQVCVNMIANDSYLNELTLCEHKIMSTLVYAGLLSTEDSTYLPDYSMSHTGIQKSVCECA